MLSISLVLQAKRASMDSDKHATPYQWPHYAMDFHTTHYFKKPLQSYEAKDPYEDPDTIPLTAFRI